MGAIDGNQKRYKQIIDLIEELGHSVLTKHSITSNIDDIRSETPAEAELAAKKIQSWIKKADIVIYEVTRPDISIGYEISTALATQKPVIVLYESGVGEPPHGLKGIQIEKLQVLEYSDKTVKEALQLALEYASDTSDVRFNFFISPTIGVYLDWISKNKKVPRSVFLRDLIQKDMESNAEYQQG